MVDSRGLMVEGCVLDRRVMPAVIDGTEDDAGRQIELCEMTYRGDRYRFRATLVRGD